MPGSRERNGRIALKRCVTSRDAEVEGCARLRGRRVRVPGRDDDAALEQRARSARPPRAARAPASSASPAPRRAAGRAARGRARAGAPGGCVPGRSGERNGPSRCAPRTAGRAAFAGIARSAATIVSSAEVMNVGWYAVTPPRAAPRRRGRSRRSRPRGSRPRVAVHLEVDEARYRDPSARPRGEPDRDDAPSSTSTSPGTSSPRTSAASTPSLMADASAARAPPSRRRRRGARAPCRIDTGEDATSATRASPPAAASAASTSSCERSACEHDVAPRTLALSFAFSGATLTIKPAYVRPSRIIATVESVFNASFCAVPALRRSLRDAARRPAAFELDEPAAARLSPTRRGAQRRAHRRLARRASSAASVNGVDPLALMPTTASCVPTASAAISASPRSRVVLGVLAVAGDERDDLAGRRPERRFRAQPRRARRASPTCRRRRRRAAHRRRGARRSRRWRQPERPPPRRRRSPRPSASTRRSSTSRARASGRAPRAGAAP